MKRPNQKIKNASVCEENGIAFKSKLERAVYRHLRSRGISPRYEADKFIIWNRDKFSVPYYDRYGGVFKRVERKPSYVSYTPDFLFKIKDITVILEVKGFKNDVFPYKVRLFRDYLESLDYNTRKNICYAVVYSIKDVEILLQDINKESNGR